MGSIKIIFDKCKGCGRCIGACSFDAIIDIQKDKVNKNGYFTVECVCPEKCTGCTMCAVMCPECAIIVERQVKE